MGATKNEMVGWHHRLNGQEFEQTLGDSEGQGSLMGCGLCAESDTPQPSAGIALSPDICLSFYFGS